MAIKRFIKIGTLGRTYISTAKCLMENSDLITRTSYGKNNGENTITSIERVTQVYKHNKGDINIGTHCTHVSV